MILISTSLSLLVIVAGIFLYAQTIKDNLSRYFKIAACLIITAGVLNLFVGGACYIAKKIYKVGAYHNKMKNACFGKKNKKYMNKHMSHRMMNKENCADKMMNCNEWTGESSCSCSMSGGKSCIRENVVLKKDTMVRKR